MTKKRKTILFLVIAILLFGLSRSEFNASKSKNNPTKLSREVNSVKHKTEEEKQIN